MRHIVFLLEEPSAQDALQVWVPQWLPHDVQVHYQVFQGKQDLEKRMVMRIRNWLLPNTRFIVMRDQDSGDCKAVKVKLKGLCAEAGRPDAVVRVACRELEAFFVGDWQAVAMAFSRRIAPWVEPARNRSPSFHALRSAVMAVGAA